MKIFNNRFYLFLSLQPFRQQIPCCAFLEAVPTGEFSELLAVVRVDEVGDLVDDDHIGYPAGEAGEDGI